MNSIINIPADTLVAGLRQRRDELAAQLERLTRTTRQVESDLEALDQAMQVIGGQRSRTTVPLPVAPQTLPVAPTPARRNAVGRRGDLPAAIRRVLAENGPLTMAEIRYHLPPDMATGKKVPLSMNSMAGNGIVTNAPVAGFRRKRSWSLTDKGRRLAVKEGGAA